MEQAEIPKGVKSAQGEQIQHEQKRENKQPTASQKVFSPGGGISIKIGHQVTQGYGRQNYQFKGGGSKVRLNPLLYGKRKDVSRRIRSDKKM